MWDGGAQARKLPRIVTHKPKKRLSKVPMKLYAKARIYLESISNKSLLAFRTSRDCIVMPSGESSHVLFWWSHLPSKHWCQDLGIVCCQNPRLVYSTVNPDLALDARKNEMGILPKLSPNISHKNASSIIGRWHQHPGTFVNAPWSWPRPCYFQ